MTRVEELFEQVRSLEPAELEDLLSRVAGEFADPPISAEWLALARERSQKLDSGEDTGLSWPEVRERMYRRARAGGD